MSTAATIAAWCLAAGIVAFLVGLAVLAAREWRRWQDEDMRRRGL